MLFGAPPCLVGLSIWPLGRRMVGSAGRGALGGDRSGGDRVG
jgi:hypothetical protein